VARGSGNAVEFLYKLRESLSEAQRAALWPENVAHVFIEDFSGSKPPQIGKDLDEQGRELVKSEIEPKGSRTSGASAFIEISESKQEGRSLYGVPTQIALSEKPFSLRACVKQASPPDIRLSVVYWFNTAKRSSEIVIEEEEPLEGGWRWFMTRGNLYEEQKQRAERAGYDMSDGVIGGIRLTLPQGPANKFWLAPIEVCIP